MRREKPMATAHITLRVSQELLTAVEQAAAQRGIARSRWIKDRLREGLAGGVPPAATAPNWGPVQELFEVELPALHEAVASLQEGSTVLESILKLCIETVMIGRQIALKQGDRLLEQAQINAREYYGRLNPAPARPSGESPVSNDTSDSHSQG
jgi:hypothetical protein